MPNTLIATVTIEINADQISVWKYLTTPELITQYFFGTEAVSDWKVGSSIVFRGEWEGKKYEDKGIIQENQYGKILRYNYWSSMSGTPDIPENYANVTYQLTPKNNTTILTIIQDGIKNEEGRKHSEENWLFVFNGLKSMLEKK